MSFVRRAKAPRDFLVIASNFTPVPRTGYAVPFPVAGRWREIVNTDAHVYGGSDMGNLGAVTAEPSPLNGKPAQAMVTLPPLSTLYFMQDG